MSDLPLFPAEHTFRTLARFPGYAVTDSGNVWSCRTTGRHAGIGSSWHLLRPAFLKRTNSRGGTDLRPMVNIQRRNRYVCRLVLEAFVGECPPGSEACHQNGDPTDNRLDNLRWDTHIANQRDMIDHGTSGKGSKNSRAKLTENQVVSARQRIASGERPTVVARELGVTYRHLWSVVSGRKWAHL